MNLTMAILIILPYWFFVFWNETFFEYKYLFVSGQLFVAFVLFLNAIETVLEWNRKRKIFNIEENRRKHGSKNNHRISIKGIQRDDKRINHPD